MSTETPAQPLLTPEQIVRIQRNNLSAALLDKENECMVAQQQCDAFAKERDALAVRVAELEKELAALREGDGVVGSGGRLEPAVPLLGNGRGKHAGKPVLE